MKNIIQSLRIITIALLLSSCGGSEESSVTATAVTADVDAFKVYELDTIGPRVRFAETIEKVELMRLEETDDALLSYVGELISADDKYLLSSGKTGDIYFFSKAGEFLSKVNRQGEGPEEYTGVNDKWIHNNALFVYSKNQKSVKEYSLNGDFVEAHDVVLDAAQVVPYGDGYALDMNRGLIDDTLAYNVVLLNSDFKREELLAPFKPIPSSFGMSSEFNGFQPYNNDFVYLRTMSDTLFLLQNKDLKPLARFDFGKYWLWNDERLSDPAYDVVEIMQSNSLIWNLGVRVHSKWLYLNYMSSFLDTKAMMIDRTTGAYRLLDFRSSADEKYTMNALHWEGDRLLFSISSASVADFLEELSEGQWQFREGTTLEEIESSENPVMMWVKLKDQWPD